MIINISIFLKNNGQIVRVVTCLDNEIDLQYNHNTENYIKGIYPGNEFYVENSLPIKIPIAPNAYDKFNFDTKTWLDTRTVEIQWRVVKSQRNQLLLSSDWTQMPDVAISTKTNWATYRQTLRDITTQSDPFNIVWPVPPGG